MPASTTPVATPRGLADALVEAGRRYRERVPHPWWVVPSPDPVAALLAHPSRGLLVLRQHRPPPDPLTCALVEGLRFPHHGEDLVLLGPRFALFHVHADRTDAWQSVRSYYNFVEPADTDETVALALGLWDPTAGPGAGLYLIDQAFTAARHLLAR